MATHLLAALGAGLAAAALFIVPVRGTMAAMMLAMFAPLPVMIAGLAFSPSIALAAAFVGFVACALILHPLAAVIFVLWAALPAWWLTRIAWLARPPQGDEQPGPDGFVWFPVGRLLLWIAGFGMGAAMLIVAIGIVRFGGFEAFMTETAKALTAMFAELLKTQAASQAPRGMGAEDLANFFLRSVLPQLAAWSCLTLSVNLWLAGRVALASQQLKRPWPDIAMELRLPQELAFVFAAALVFTFFGGLPRMLAVIVVSGAGMAFALQGFAVLHAVTRGTRHRTLNLTLIYVMNVILLPGPLILAAILGLADSFYDIRRRFGPSPSPPARQGGWPPPPANSNARD